MRKEMVQVADKIPARFPNVLCWNVRFLSQGRSFPTSTPLYPQPFERGSKCSTAVTSARSSTTSAQDSDSLAPRVHMKTEPGPPPQSCIRPEMLSFCLYSLSFSVNLVSLFCTSRCLNIPSFTRGSLCNSPKGFFLKVTQLPAECFTRRP